MVPRRQDDLPQDDLAPCLLHVEPEEAEYWDNSGTRGPRFLFDAARALLHRTTRRTKRRRNAPPTPAA